jgi:hypothetical protein
LAADFQMLGVDTNKADVQTITETASCRAKITNKRKKGRRSFLPAGDPVHIYARRTCLVAPDQLIVLMYVDRTHARARARAPVCTSPRANMCVRFSAACLRATGTVPACRLYDGSPVECGSHRQGCCSTRHNRRFRLIRHKYANKQADVINWACATSPGFAAQKKICAFHCSNVRHETWV